MIILGVTGSIGSGKSFFSKALAREKGVVLYSSDAEVHRLYASDKKLLKEIKKHFPKAVVDGAIDRQILGGIVFNDSDKKQLLEDIVYPLLKAQRRAVIADAVKRKVKLVVLEVPLLFENGIDAECDLTITVYCSPHIERLRAMRRPGMTEAKLNSILAAQMPVSEKIKRSNLFFNTGQSKANSVRAVKKLYNLIVNS